MRPFSVVGARRGAAAALATALLLTVVAGCGGDDSPSSGDVPSGAVATVGDVEISTDRLDEQVDALARAQRPVGDGAKADASDGSDDDAVAKAEREQLEAQALSMLLMREALEQEAADRGIEVSDEEVSERWEAASQGQFKTEKALKRFLGGQTVEDLLAQLRLQVITERIHEQVSEQAGGGKDGKKAVANFQKEFQQRWQDRTACAEGYNAAGCADDSK